MLAPFLWPFTAIVPNNMVSSYGNIVSLPFWLYFYMWASTCPPVHLLINQNKRQNPKGRASPSYLFSQQVPVVGHLLQAKEREESLFIWVKFGKLIGGYQFPHWLTLQGDKEGRA